MDRPVRLLVAGGVTGGHLFPGIAAADALRDRIPDARVLFVSTGRPLERAALARAGYPLRVVPFGGIKGRGFGGAMRTLAGLPPALFRALWIVREFEPDIVLGLGGYASVPGVLAARPGGALAVLHEQNVRPGAANRLLARVAHRIYTAFPEVRGLPADRVRFVGNPVRAAIRDAAGAPLPEGPFAVLVVGGSQGARGINRAVAEALPALVRAGIRLMHQTGEADFSAMEAAFRAAGASGEVRPFFADMARRYRACHLVLSRSGASTAAEIAAVGRGAVLVPFPFAADDHQTANARALVAAGAAETIPESALDGDALARILVRLADRPAQVAAMARAARTLGRPDAASRMVADILALSERFGREGGSAKAAKSADSNLR